MFIILINQTNHFHRFNIQGAKKLRTVNHLFWNWLVFKIVTGLTFYVIIIAGILFVLVFCRTKRCAIRGWWLFRKVIRLWIFVYGVVFSGWDHLSMKFFHLFGILIRLFGHWLASCVRSIWWHHFGITEGFILTWTA